MKNVGNIEVPVIFAKKVDWASDLEGEKELAVLHDQSKKISIEIFPYLGTVKSKIMTKITIACATFFFI